MKLSFRQGIARYQTDVSSNPIFLQRSSAAGNFIDLLVSPDPTVIIFAHRDANYVVDEVHSVSNAWGPFSGTVTSYLFWDINLLTGHLTRGTTLLAPMYTGVAPVAPAFDQHWFDTTNAIMFVWNGAKWLEKIRVFAGYITSSAIIHPNRLGSQANLTGDFEGGNIVLDAYNKPLRQSDGTFVTTVTGLIISNNSAKKVKFEAEVMVGMAAEPIPKFSLVQVRSNRTIVNNRSTEYMSRIAGIVTEDLYLNEVGYIVPDGLIRNDLWTFPISSIGRPIFSGPNGEVTISPPQAGVCQIAGFVYDVDSVYINVQSPIILDEIFTDVPLPPPPTPLPPVADFESVITSGIAPLTVNFTSTSLNAPTALEWDFTNDGTFDAVGPNVTHVYDQPGTYTVRLRALNSFGQDDEVKAGFVVVEPARPGTHFTNLGIRLGGPAQALKSGTFQVSINISNDGFQTATAVQRTIVIPDLKTEQIIVSNLPPGSKTARIGSRLLIKLPEITHLATGQIYGPIFFTVHTPPMAGKLTVAATVASPEVDSTLNDNTTTLVVEVK